MQYEKKTLVWFCRKNTYFFVFLRVCNCDYCASDMMILSSLKNNTEFLSDPWAFPSVFKWENYAYAIKYGVGQYFLNSVIVTAASVISYGIF